MVKVVLDTNIICASILPSSRYHSIIQKFKNREFNLCVSNEIMLEYFEILDKIYNYYTAINFVDSLKTRSNVRLVNPSYKYNLIPNDPDDNKFIDCYLASESDYLITNDRHFDQVKNLKHPKIKILSILDFYKLMQSI